MDATTAQADKDDSDEDNSEEDSNSDEDNSEEDSNSDEDNSEEDSNSDEDNSEEDKKPGKQREKGKVAKIDEESNTSDEDQEEEEEQEGEGEKDEEDDVKNPSRIPKDRVKFLYKTSDDAETESIEDWNVVMNRITDDDLRKKFSEGKAYDMNRGNLRRSPKVVPDPKNPKRTGLWVWNLQSKWLRECLTKFKENDYYRENFNSDVKRDKFSKMESQYEYELGHVISWSLCGESTKNNVFLQNPGTNKNLRSVDIRLKTFLLANENRRGDFLMKAKYDKDESLIPSRIKIYVRLIIEGGLVEQKKYSFPNPPG
ncbi:hypothetical protein WR25_05756 [Diploscapter pachys]|uniref:Uncharacterized protein n=1 Tax=Diploscapter pachys TaxID=2018661 RepID=A0A2A2J9M6_9BILA|nr:hypothetical protein WR25_05756 [Diploscapter pachys]